MTGKVLTERMGHILSITINRPEKGNAFDWDVIMGLADAYSELCEDPQLRCAVVSAAGPNFCGGLDLADMMPRIAANDMDGRGLVNPFRVAQGDIALRESTKPILVAIHGKCFTAGIELALAADIVIAGSDAVFAQAEVRRGIFPMGGATFRMPQSFGWQNAMRWLLTGDPFDAAEAHRIGLVQEVTAPGGHVARAMEIAQRISSAAPLGVQATLANARKAEAEGPTAAARAILPAAQELFDSDDAREGMASLIEKREPVFAGR